ncbi:MAG: hypothetical protein M1380_05165 [Chloroflexi bacterium]|nr:hypothetical protein [Chloroflexota bacterium]
MGPGGMMGPGGAAGQQPGPTPFPYGQWPAGPGGMMGPGMMGGGMMGGPYASTVKPIAVDEAVRIAERQLQNLGNPDLAFDEVHSFAYNFYVPVKEKSTGNFAFELLIDRYSGSVMPEMGPNMMWNTKYGMMAGGMMGPGGFGPGGMMGPGGQVTPTVDTPVTQDQAVQAAQQFLDGFLPGTKTGGVHSFYGYRTIDVERDGQMVGMLSVIGYNGAVWYHTWHGDFLESWQRPTAQRR